MKMDGEFDDGAITAAKVDDSDTDEGMCLGPPKKKKESIAGSNLLSNANTLHLHVTSMMRSKTGQHTTKSLCKKIPFTSDTVRKIVRANDDALWRDASLKNFLRGTTKVLKRTIDFAEGTQLLEQRLQLREDKKVKSVKPGEPKTCPPQCRICHGTAPPLRNLLHRMQPGQPTRIFLLDRHARCFDYALQNYVRQEEAQKFFDMGIPIILFSSLNNPTSLTGLQPAPRQRKVAAVKDRPTEYVCLSKQAVLHDRNEPFEELQLPRVKATSKKSLIYVDGHMLRGTAQDFIEAYAEEKGTEDFILLEQIPIEQFVRKVAKSESDSGVKEEKLQPTKTAADKMKKPELEYEKKKEDELEKIEPESEMEKEDEEDHLLPKFDQMPVDEFISKYFVETDGEVAVPFEHVTVATRVEISSGSIFSGTSVLPTSSISRTSIPSSRQTSASRWASAQSLGYFEVSESVDTSAAVRPTSRPNSSGSRPASARTPPSAASSRRRVTTPRTPQTSPLKRSPPKTPVKKRPSKTSSKKMSKDLASFLIEKVPEPGHGKRVSLVKDQPQPESPTIERKDSQLEKEWVPSPEPEGMPTEAVRPKIPEALRGMEPYLEKRSSSLPKVSHKVHKGLVSGKSLSDESRGKASLGQRMQQRDAYERLFRRKYSHTEEGAEEPLFQHRHSGPRLSIEKGQIERKTSDRGARRRKSFAREEDMESVASEIISPEPGTDTEHDKEMFDTDETSKEKEEPESPSGEEPRSEIESPALSEDSYFGLPTAPSAYRRKVAASIRQKLAAEARKDTTSKWHRLMLDELTNQHHISRFTLPMDLKELEQMSPLEYIKKFCRVMSYKEAMLYKTFIKFKNKAGHLPMAQLRLALQDVYPDTLHTIPWQKACDFIGLPKDEIDFRTFAGLCTLSERMFWSRDESWIRKANRQCDELERADFHGLNFKLKGINVPPGTERLLYCIQNAVNMPRTRVRLGSLTPRASHKKRRRSSNKKRKRSSLVKPRL